MVNFSRRRPEPMATGNFVNFTRSAEGPAKRMACVNLCQLYPGLLPPRERSVSQRHRRARPSGPRGIPIATASTAAALSHLQRLEAESLHILREAVAEAQRPVMLYSAGKDSSVMLHLARKAFFPAPPPFPLLHVDTGWKFRAMYELRDRAAAAAGMELDRPPQPRGRGEGHQPVRPRPPAHPPVEDRGAQAGARRATASTRRSAAPAATRRRAAPRNGW